MALKLVVSNGPVKPKLKSKKKVAFGDRLLINLIQDGHPNPEFLKFLAEKVKTEYAQYDLNDVDQFDKVVSLLSNKLGDLMGPTRIAVFLGAIQRGFILDAHGDALKIAKRAVEENPDVDFSEIASCSIIDKYKKELPHGQMLVTWDILEEAEKYQEKHRAQA